MTDPDRQLSDLKLERRECEKCGATWINGQHIWGGTGNQGNELDLASLVCNKLVTTFVSIQVKVLKADKPGIIEQVLLMEKLKRDAKC